MSDLILHHYPQSPFAEKARLMLGYKQLAWQSVHIPMLAPKPELVALTGGYRRTPVLQIGADIYCDTALICDVLEHLAPTPTLYPAPRGLARTLAQWGDNTLFWASIAWSMQATGLADMFGGAPPEAAQAFGADRRAMRATMGMARPSDAAAAYKSYLRRLGDMLHAQPFLLGSQPSVADFACYHPLWFTQTQTPSRAAILETSPLVQDWLARMAALGHGTSTACSAAQAIDKAASAEPAVAQPLLRDSMFQDEHGIALGSLVSVRAESFGTEACVGVLLAASRTHYSLRRNDPRAGTVHVHFPRIGYVLQRAEENT